MGQKVHPRGFRLGVSKDWASRWFGGKNYSKYLIEDEKIRQHVWGRKYLIQQRSKNVAIEASGDIDEVYIERPSPSKVVVTVHTAKPGVVIGSKGKEVQALRAELTRLTGKEVVVNIKEIKTPEMDALLVSQNIAGMLERRTSHKRAMKRVMRLAERNGAQGIKVMVAGRLGGAEIARTEWYRQGRIPLQTLKADIDYGFCQAKTKTGIIGVKVWIYHGDVSR
ncbi:MAG TPA: 30S ribosomal protein S3 [Thermotogota bacterium]|nr:30S ribosomal protein S3 [Thermotogota bacterium]HRW91370.1 30S ribosomal protein S3 [Thermotogota bacterium]